MCESSFPCVLRGSSCQCWQRGAKEGEKPGGRSQADNRQSELGAWEWSGRKQSTYRLEGGPVDQVKGSNLGPALQFRNYCLSFLIYKRKIKGDIPHRIVVTNKKAYKQKTLKMRQ